MATAFTFGKFNILHKGHEKLFLDALSECDTLYIGVSSHSKNVPVEVRLEAIETLLAPYVEAGRVKFVVAPNMFLALGEVGEGATIYLGEDRERSAKDLARRFHGSARTVGRLTSSTAVRALLDASKDVSAVVPQQIIRYAKVARLIEVYSNVLKA